MPPLRTIALHGEQDDMGGKAVIGVLCWIDANLAVLRLSFDALCT